MFSKESVAHECKGLSMEAGSTAITPATLGGVKQGM